MSRYIDADALKKTIDREIFRHDTTDHVFQIIDDAPSIDIVFCKECKHRGICFGRLVQGTKVVQLNFCSYGERR